MRVLTVRNKTRGKVLGGHIQLADTFTSRLRGLTGARRLERGGGLLLSPCRSVHTIGCLQPLDVLFIDRRGCVVAVYENLRPMRVTRWVSDAEYALELPTGTISSTDTQVRDRLAWIPSPGPWVDVDAPPSLLGRDNGAPAPRRPWPSTQHSPSEVREHDRRE